MNVDSSWQLLLLATAGAIVASTLVFFVRFPKTRAHPGPVLICLILSSCLGLVFRAATYLASPGDSLTAIGHQNATAASPPAAALFWSTLYFTSATSFWFLMLAMDLISSLSNPFLPFQSNSMIHHTLAWPLAAGWCLVFNVVFYHNSHLSPLHLRLLFALPLYGALAYIVVALRAAWIKSSQLVVDAHETTRRMAKLIVPYLVVFGATGGVTLVVYVAELAHGAPTLIATYVDELVSAVATIALFVLFYFDSGVGFCRAARDRRSRLGTMPSPQEFELQTAGTDDVLVELEAANFDVDIAAGLRKMIMILTRRGIVSAAARDPTTLVHGRIPKPEDFTTVEKKRITFVGTAATVADGLVFEDVAPSVFHSLRELFGIDHEQYLRAFDPDENLREICSEGKSGNIFYFTANKQFMVKSVPKEEFDVLRAILPAYYNYLLEHRASYLCRYFGCHSITLPVGTRRMYFVVMHNLFSEGPVHQRYDLKGNTDRRQAIPSVDVESTMRKTVQRERIDKLMMDIDFSRIHQSILFADANVVAAKARLEQDIQFLVDQHIMDYSILVGVQHLDGPCLSPVAGGAILSRDGTNFYSMGIIDMLQRYNWRWTVQRWFLGGVLCKDTSDVSAVPPVQYGQRLINFIHGSMFDEARRTSRTSGLTTQPSPTGTFDASSRLSGFAQGFEGTSGTTPATEMWLATNLSDEIIECGMDIHDCAILEED
ncbi:Aste57867_21706 [Aphanomyces stellatus]|uniref:Aste57867_21706 protein n=1 Tax=Aphanomyces stellatus TaxID=120398 RepID=A0A485LIW5_9STRA|nr:hypothetical protein As57867_021637 [Aphanomyces stellatus]VFT98375.1 Aste57867_21706 [Aphanomyces stellatus]